MVIEYFIVENSKTLIANNKIIPKTFSDRIILSPDAKWFLIPEFFQ